METDDDLVVIIVDDGDGENESSKRKQSFKIKKEVSEEDTGGEVEELEFEEIDVDQLLETAEKHGEVIIGKVKEEPVDTEYLDDGGNAGEDYDDEEEYVPNYNDISDEEEGRSTGEQYLDDDLEHEKEQPHRYKMLHPSDRKSFVKQLRKDYPELATDKELLIATLSQIMRGIKAPEPPKDYFIMNGINFECVLCGAFTISQPAAGRHWQEKHGTRYLVCFACGVDFRSTTNLYKHEKRCNAPDAVIVLKARALTLGRKGRSRPFLPKDSDIVKFKNKVQSERKRFPCPLCPAEYTTKQTLQSHMFVHSGERPYRCEQCVNAYTSRSGLARHIATHSDVQYICDYCSRPFKTKINLIAHLDTHQPLRKHLCVRCGRRYAQKMALSLHVRRAHLQLPPPIACQICPKRYPRMSLLKTHMLREHGMNLMTRNMLYKSLPKLTDTQLQQAKIVLKSDTEHLDNNMYTILEEPPKLEVEFEELVNYELPVEMEYQEENEQDYYANQEIDDDNKEAVIEHILKYQREHSNTEETGSEEVESLAKQILYETTIEITTLGTEQPRPKRGRAKAKAKS